MRFNPGVISKAAFRQYDNKKLGIPCAKCGKYLNMLASQGQAWFAIPRIPVEQGGKSAENCVVVCPKCNVLLDQDGTKIIPDSALPHYRY